MGVADVATEGSDPAGRAKVAASPRRPWTARGRMPTRGTSRGRTFVLGTRPASSGRERPSTSPRGWVAAPLNYSVINSERCQWSRLDTFGTVRVLHEDAVARQLALRGLRANDGSMVQDALDKWPGRDPADAARRRAEAVARRYARCCRAVDGALGARDLPTLKQALDAWPFARDAFYAAAHEQYQQLALLGIAQPLVAALHAAERLGPIRPPADPAITAALGAAAASGMTGRLVAAARGLRVLAEPEVTPERLEHAVSEAEEVGVCVPASAAGRVEAARRLREVGGYVDACRLEAVLAQARTHGLVGELVDLGARKLAAAEALRAARKAPSAELQVALEAAKAQKLVGDLVLQAQQRLDQRAARRKEKERQAARRAVVERCEQQAADRAARQRAERRAQRRREQTVVTRGGYLNAGNDFAVGLTQPEALAMVRMHPGECMGFTFRKDHPEHCWVKRRGTKLTPSADWVAVLVRAQAPSGPPGQLGVDLCPDRDAVADPGQGPSDRSADARAGGSNLAQELEPAEQSGSLLDDFESAEQSKLDESAESDGGSDFPDP